LDAHTYQVYKKPGWHVYARWSTVDPNIIFHILGNTFHKWNVRTGADTVLHTFGEGNISLGSGEGNISVDDTTAVFNVGTLVIVYDITNNLIVAKKDLGNAGSDWISSSQSGQYVVSNTISGPVRVYDRNLNLLRQIWPLGGHADLGYTTGGQEVHAQVCVPMAMTRLDTGAATDLLPSDQQCGHLSQRNYKRTGWALKSGNGELFAIKLDGSGTVERFAHEHTNNNTYDNAAKGVISPNGTKVMWNSDWGNGSVYAYVAEMP
jgi:hypothetical protein